jgi:hypothetical protein
VQAVGAHATHEGAETLLGGEIGAFLDQRSADWKRISDPIWKERQKKTRFSHHYKGDTLL